METFSDHKELEISFKVSLIEAQLVQLDAKLADLEEINRKIQNLCADDALKNIISENEQYVLQKQILKAKVIYFIASKQTSIQ